jgi:hypothetical protein
VDGRLNLSSKEHLLSANAAPQVRADKACPGERHAHPQPFTISQITRPDVIPALPPSRIIIASRPIRGRFREASDCGGGVQVARGLTHSPR